MQVINMTGADVFVFTADVKGRKTLDVLIHHGEDKRILGYPPPTPQMLSCHKGKDEPRNNKFQVLPEKPLIYGNEGNKVIIRHHKDPRPEV